MHIASATLAMVLGLMVLVRAKGTRSHRRLGFVYVLSMALLNISAFGMYRLFGTFGAFHVAALVSASTVVAGILAILKRPRTQRQVELHLVFMYWSVIGLYAAFFSELMVRVRINAAFMILVSCATGATILLVRCSNASWLPNGPLKWRTSSPLTNRGIGNRERASLPSSWFVDRYGRYRG
ncbi:MAG: DUF2306 domain-containing protein [Flavobacteriales bacterium]|nr:DUF2306 domain-containing protein [Flavobacteriales bacterium]